MTGSVLAIWLALIGRVVACDGSPLPGVTVSAGDQKQTTGVDGRFVLDTRERHVVAQFDGFGRIEQDVCANRDVEITLPLNVIDDCVFSGPPPTSRTFEGRVVSIDDKPVRGARVRIGTKATKTDRRGRFRTSGVPFGRYVVAITAPGYAAKTIELQSSACTPPCERPLVIRLTRC